MESQQDMMTVMMPAQNPLRVDGEEWLLGFGVVNPEQGQGVIIIQGCSVAFRVDTAFGLVPFD